jgi:hypothetical protein
MSRRLARLPKRAKKNENLMESDLQQHAEYGFVSIISGWVTSPRGGTRGGNRDLPRKPAILDQFVNLFEAQGT